MITTVKLNDLHAILVHRINNRKCINILSENIVKDNIYNNIPIQHLLCNLKDVPHIPYVNDDKETYIRYMKSAGEYAGFGLEHSFEIFDNLIKNFKYLESPYEDDYITCKIMFNRLVIVNGLHRASILSDLKVENVKIKIVT